MTDQLSIKANSNRLKDLRKKMAESFTSRPEMRPHVLVAREEDRHEAHDFVMRLVHEHIGLHADVRFIHRDAELKRELDDTHPDILVVMHGDRVSTELQMRMASIYTDPFAARPPLLLVFTERDPGDLAAAGDWVPPFREVFRMTFIWPTTVERRKDWIRLFLAGVKKRGPFELANDGRNVLLDHWDDEAPDTVSDILRLSKKAVEIAGDYGTTKLTNGIVAEALGFEPSRDSGVVIGGRPLSERPRISSANQG